MKYSLEEIRNAVYETLSQLNEEEYEKAEKLFLEFKRNLEEGE